MPRKIIMLLPLCMLLATATGLKAQEQWKVVKQELVFDNPPFKQCHASTITEIKTGELLLACFGGSQEGKKDVSIWFTKLNKEDKGKPEIIADGVQHDSVRFASWNPVLFKTKKGKVFLFYKVGPNPREWWGMFKTSDDEGKTWSQATRLPEGILGPIKNKPIQLANGTILAPSSVEEQDGRWKVHLEKSTDMGKTWEFIPVDTTSFDVIQPSILSYGNKKLQILCRSRQGNVIQAWSEDNGDTWGKLSKTELLNPNSGTDAVTLKDGKQLIVYNPDVPGKDWFNGRAKLRVACSADGLIWKDIAVLENGTKEEYSYPAIIQTKDGLIHITYTFDRKNIKHVVLQEGK
ncbi:sialidase family protein [Mucilaginibacter sabulilitoris]|uniref:Sialidase family protein n=1 Tax=Mucilaginibacter sabulilitoris TaxID=1173583 RepID=A0ABZ0TUV9_9SPHI|nr:sialidase family protein [Mucilaginibacter sabulilitoris]WPU96247.1 sialidase family protein [Mucilaginibacter sabulilitoris]